MKRSEFLKAYEVATREKTRKAIQEALTEQNGGFINEQRYHKAQRIAGLRFWRVHYKTLRLHTVAEVFPALRGK